MARASISMRSSFFIIILIVIAFGLYRWHQTALSHRHTDTLIVGTNAEYAPFTLLEDGAIVGFDIDVAYEIARRIGKKIELVDMPFDMLLPKAQLGDIHIIAAGLSSTPERAKRILFARPHLSSDPLLIVSLASREPIKNLDALQGKEVVVNEGYTADAFVSELPGITVRRLLTPADAILALRSNRADAFVTARNTIQPFFDKYGRDAFNVITIPNTHDDYSIAISPKHKELLPIIQQALDTMERDGTLNLFKKKWRL